MINKKEYDPGDVVWICGVIVETGKNPYCRGIVHHKFEGHWKDDTNYVIAVDILDGDFEVRETSCTWPTELGHREPI